MRSFSAGETLYRIGERANGIYGVLDGSVAISIPSDVGTVYDCYLGRAGFWIGDLALFSHANRLVSVTAETDLKCWYVSQKLAMELVKADPEMMRYFYLLTHTNLTITLRVLANIAIPDNASRLAAWLICSDDGLPVPGGWIKASQEQIAMQNIMSLPTTRRMLKRFQSQDLIELGYGQVRIKNRVRLLASSKA